MCGCVCVYEGVCEGVCVKEWGGSGGIRGTVVAHWTTGQQQVE